MKTEEILHRPATLRARGKTVADARADSVGNAVCRDETPTPPLHYLDVIASIIFRKARIVTADAIDESSNRSTQSPLGFRVDFLEAKTRSARNSVIRQAARRRPR
ncbi:hypothetical protein, partial [Escherichia coli]|uniref:hypothetical protein n=1 Tax=Escherichia coli TaxID=562 RepID=UPI001BDD0AA7